MAVQLLELICGRIGIEVHLRPDALVAGISLGEPEEHEQVDLTVQGDLQGIDADAAHRGVGDIAGKGPRDS